MNIKELCCKVDPEKVLYAYLLDYPMVDQRLNSKRENWLNEFDAAKERILEKLDMLKGQEIIDVPEGTVYVYEKALGMFDEGKYPALDIAVIKDPEADYLLDDSCSVWESDGKKLLECGCEQGLAQDMLGSYRIADSSVEKYGTTMCCAAVIHALVSFTIEDARRQKKYMEDLAAISERIKYIDRPGTAEEKEAEYKISRSEYHREKKIYKMRMKPIRERALIWSFEEEFNELAEQVRQERVLK